MSPFVVSQLPWCRLVADLIGGSRWIRVSCCFSVSSTHQSRVFFLFRLLIGAFVSSAFQVSEGRRPLLLFLSMLCSQLSFFVACMMGLKLSHKTSAPISLHVTSSSSHGFSLSGWILRDPACHLLDWTVPRVEFTSFDGRTKTLSPLLHMLPSWSRLWDSLRIHGLFSS